MSESAAKFKLFFLSLFHQLLAWVEEATMKIPIVSVAQVRILSEGIVEALPACGTLPADLAASTRFSDEQILQGLPAPGRFARKDLRWCAGSKLGQKIK